MPIRILVIVAFTSVGCGSDGSRCRDNTECSGAERCQVGDPGGACGIPCEMMRLCESSAECGVEVCVEFVGNCCFAGELSSRCQPACDETSCPGGQRCNAAGLCEVVPCTEAGCSTHFMCDAAAVDERTTGCVRVACSRDADCAEDGFCVSGRCWDEPGMCVVPMAVP